VVPVARVITGVEDGQGGASLPAASDNSPGNGLALYIGGAALLGAILVGGLLLWLWLSHRRAAGEQDLSRN
jgi:hypothetical protein